MKSKIFTKIAKNIQVTILAIAIIVSSIQFSGVTEVKADDATFTVKNKKLTCRRFPTALLRKSAKKN